MQPTEHTMLNALIDRMARVPFKHHKFLLRLNALRNRRPYLQLSPGQAKYLRSLHERAVSDGVVDAVAA